MKTTALKLKTVLVCIGMLLCYSQQVEAQFLKKLKERVKDTAEETVLRKTEEKVTQKTEQTFDTIINGKIVKRKRKVKKNPSNKPNQRNTTNSSDEIIEDTSSEIIKPWSKYNFVPGDEIIFEDDLLDEENGEFPSRWDLIAGSAENAVFGDENIISLKRNSIITPLMDKESYLPEVFTIEFDAYFFSEKGFGSGWQNYGIRFSPKGKKVYYPEGSEDYFYPIILQRDRAKLAGEVNGVKKNFEGSEGALDVQPIWRHFAIAFNKRSLKVFVDEHRVLSIPNLGKGFKPQQFSIMAYSYYDEGYVRAIKNIRIAKGGKKLYDRVLADGKFVTRGILFDVNKASIQPASYGVINKVAKMMQEHTDLNFSIEGHTDSDGEALYNEELSLRRAEAVKKALINAGISQDRLETKGMGESVPFTDNASAEAKANNRRVEFVKL